MDYKTTQFNYYLDECYFHSERDKEFVSETEKNLARKAMELLWNKENIKVHDITYSNEEIREKLLDEMMPEILDTGICTCDLIFIQIILKMSELLSLP